jgi:tetratricopeptide (TPR) repeat protein
MRIYDISIPDNSPMIVTVCEVARAYEAVWYREGNADYLYLKKGSSSLPAKEREEYVGVILGRNSDAHELADMEMANDNFDAAERILDNILFSNTRDFRAWIGKLECSAYAYDSDKAIDCFMKAVNIDKEAARDEVFSILVHLKMIYLEFTTKTYTHVDLKTREVTREKSDMPFDGKWEVEELKTTIEDITESYCDEFPSTAESHLLRFTNCVIHGKIADALAELEMARTIGSKKAEIQTLIEVEELEARWLTTRQSLLSFTLASLLLGSTAYFVVYALSGFLDKWGGSWIDKVNVVALSSIPFITAIIGLFILANFMRLRKAARKHFGIPPGRRT